MADGGGLENRYGARVSSWVRIPHPPLDTTPSAGASGAGRQLNPKNPADRCQEPRRRYYLRNLRGQLRRATCWDRKEESK